MGEVTRKSRISVWISVFFILTLLWMGLIYWFSSNDGAESSDMSGKLLRKLLSVVIPDWSSKTRAEQRHVIEKVHLLFRKFGHFSEYLVLGVFLHITCTLFRAKKLKQIKSRQAHPILGMIVPALLAFLYACSDEYHQLFVAGRSGEFRDVMIDFSGACLGILLSLPICLLIRRKLRRRAAGKHTAERHRVSANVRQP